MQNFIPKIGDALVALVFSIACAMATIFTDTAQAQTAADARAHLVSRYFRENTQNDALSYWPTEVIAKFVGVEDVQIQQAALRDLLKYAYAADTKVVLPGFPDRLFDTATVPDLNVNFLVLEYGPDSEAPLLEGIVSQFGTSLEPYLDARHPVSRILGSGLSKQDDGCLGRWDASQSNEIAAAVIGIRSDLPNSKKESCIQALSTFGFGVNSLHNGIEVSGAAGRTMFYNPYERELALSIAAFCRNELEENTIECAHFLSEAFYQFYGSVAN